MLKNKNSFYGFTLAEVLITLGIIGVIAALTLPNLIAKYKEKVVETQAKKAASILSQALIKAEGDLGHMEDWDPEGLNYPMGHIKTLKKYIKITKDCGFGDGCGYKSIYNEAGICGRYQFVMADGTAVAILLDRNCRENIQLGDKTYSIGELRMNIFPQAGNGLYSYYTIMKPQEYYEDERPPRLIQKVVMGEMRKSNY